MNSPALQSPSEELKGIRWPVFLVVSSNEGSALTSAYKKPFSSELMLFIDKVIASRKLIL